MTAETTSRRRWVLLAVGGGVVIVIAVALALFQPWKLWVDDRVDQAAPAGAVPITAAPADTSAPVTAGPVDTSEIEPTTPPTPAAAPTPTPTPPAPPTTVPASPPAGTPFAGIDHETTGTAVVLQDAAGARFLRLEELTTSNGPDLFVYLSANTPDGPEDVFDDDYVNLGRLQGNVGSSNYAIPPDVDLARFASVVIWCDRFDSAFGAAPLV